MASTFHWTLPVIYKVKIREMYFLIEEHNRFIEKQNKELQKVQGKYGKTSISSLSQLSGLPGVKKQPKRR